MRELIESEMAGNAATHRQALTIENTGGAVVPTPPSGKRPKHIQLDTIQDVKNELARVYRSARAGHLPPEVASRFTFMLSTLGKLIELGELERRLDSLESK